MRPYAERKAARVERLKARAERTRAEGERKLAAADRIANGIPMGQPILIGHHSEKRHRKDLERMHKGTRDGLALTREADKLERRAEVAESNAAISSDDPEAVTQLKIKLEDLQAQHARWQALNKLARGFRCSWQDTPEARAAAVSALVEKLKTIPATGSEAKLIVDHGRPPSFMVTNLSGNIRRIKARIAELEARAEKPAREPLVLGDVTIDERDNRTRIHFPGKPAASVIADLKSNGFRWCRSDSCWQRMASAHAVHLAKAIVERAQASRAA